MKNKTESIKHIVGYLNNKEKDGGFWLPNIQRDFVWKEEQIERLFDSVMREYPFGTLLVWKTKSTIRKREFIKYYKDDTKTLDYFTPEDASIKSLVLDGQQRLQSFYIGFEGSYNGKELYIDLSSGEYRPPEDVRYKFKFLSADTAKFPWVKFRDVVYHKSQNPIFILNELVSQNNLTLSQDEMTKYFSTLSDLITRFVTNEAVVYQELDGVDDPDSYSESDVVEIFIRANSGGTKLEKSDLLFSLLTTSWEDSAEEMDELLTNLNKNGYEFTRDFVLKTCLTLLNKGAKYEVKKFRDEKIRMEFIEKWEEMSKAICDVRDYLYDRTYIRTHKGLPSYLVLIPLIYFRYNFPEKWNSVKGLDQYILHSLLCGAFGGASDALIDKCNKWIRENETFDVEQIFDVIRSSNKSMDITPKMILEQSYGSKYMHMVFNLWYQDFNYLPSYTNNYPQADHIFPQSLLKKKMVTGENGKSRRRYLKADIDQIANLMLLTADENGAGGKGDMTPEEWLRDKDDEYLEMHLIPNNPILWNVDSYPAFIEERKKLILEKFKPLIKTAEK